MLTKTGPVTKLPLLFRICSICDCRSGRQFQQGCEGGRCRATDAVSCRWALKARDEATLLSEEGSLDSERTFEEKGKSWPSKVELCFDRFFFQIDLRCWQSVVAGAWVLSTAYFAVGPFSFCTQQLACNGVTKVWAGVVFWVIGVVL